MKPITDNSQVYLISLHETIYEQNGEVVLTDTPQYCFGVYLSPSEAHKKCHELNDMLWQKKEQEFYQEIEKERNFHEKLQRQYQEGHIPNDPGVFPQIVYNDLARRKDREENFYKVIPIELNI